MLVVGDRPLSRSEGGNHGIGAEREKDAELVRVVGLIGDDVRGTKPSAKASAWVLS